MSGPPLTREDKEGRVELSFIMPCYNEEDVVGYTIPQVLTAFQEAGVPLELIAVDNGSTDGTAAIIRKLADANPAVVPFTISENRGYGNGILSAVPLCRGRWVGFIAADGQVDAEDVVRLYQAAAATGGKVVAKVRRRFRMDGLRRKLISVVYNTMVRVMWPGLRSIDINGTPKILPRHILEAMNLQSREWFLDPELMIKAHHLGVPVLEFNVFARMRGGGLSHVRMTACLEFLGKLLRYRLSSGWQREMSIPSEPASAAPVRENK